MTAKVLMQLPSSPQAMVAHVSNFFAGLFNPAHLFATLGSLAPGSIANADASALACPGAAYGIPCYGLPDSQVSQWTFRDNSKWVESRGLDSFKKYDKCFTTKLTDTINDPDFAPTKPDGSGGGMCNNQGDVNLQHYQMYLLDKHIVQNMVNYGNNTSKTGGTTAPTTPASGDAKQLASQILSNPKINTSGRLVVQDLQATASGLPGTSNAPISATLLGLIQTIGQNHTFTITAIESGGTGHCNNTPKPACPTDPHYTGDAFDLSGVDGVATTGRDTASLAVIADMVPLMPSGSGFGQAGCPGGTPSLPATITTFADTCTHLHVQVPAGAP